MMCQPSHSSPKGGRYEVRRVDLEAVPRRLEEGKRKEKGGWIVMSRIGWGGEQTTIDMTKT